MYNKIRKYMHTESEKTWIETVPTFMRYWFEVKRPYVPFYVLTFIFLAYTPHAQGTRYVPRKAVDIVNNLPSWAPNWARGNRVLKVGSTVFDHLPSTEPRASRSYDRRGHQVGMTYRVNMGKDNHNGRYRHWRFPVITPHAFPNDSNLNVAQPIMQYVQRYGGKLDMFWKLRENTHTHREAKSSSLGSRSRAFESKASS